MAEAKAKKKRIPDLAVECNQVSAVILTFLKDKGYAVKTINSPVTEEMQEAAYAHFMKDIKKHEEHREKIKKREEERSTIDEELAAGIGIQDSQTEVEEEPAAVPEPTPKAEEPVQEEPEPVQEELPLAEPAAEEVPEPEPADLPEPEPVAEAPAEEKVEAKIETPPPAKQELPAEPKPADADAGAVKEKPAKEKSKPAEEKKPEPPKRTNPLQKVQEQRKKGGLTIKGKLDLNEDANKRAKPSSAQNAGNKAGGVKPAPTGIGPTPVDDEAGKRKKKKIKSKPLTVQPAVTEKEDVSAKKRQKMRKFEIDEKEVKDNIRRTQLSMEDNVARDRAINRKKRKKERQEEEIRQEEIRQAEGNKITVTEYIAVSELANLMSVPVGEVIAKCMGLGLMVSINQRLETENIMLVADEFGFEVEFEKEYSASELEDTPDDESTLERRSPIVTIMGHVDHGKTSLLDYIRRTNVVAGEAGGITQHIGAYKVEVGDGKTIAFLDTPGHEAFTAMRARGAQVTDIVVLVVAADDAVMPQTVEAINHAKAADVPIIVAINKIDKPEVNLQRIKQQLADRNVLVEEWGGKYQCVELSAKTGLNVDLLLEKILLEADLLDLKANAKRAARGVVIESKLDKGRGVTATILVQKGTLRIGDPFVAGIYNGRVRAMFDERNNKVDEAPPSSPVLVLGLEHSPQAGDMFIVVESERIAREVSIKRQQLKREQDNRQVRHITLDEISRQISIGGVKELPIIVKGDVDGSVEAVKDSLMKLSTDEVVVKVIHRGVGAISEGDVILAAASNAIIIGFNVRPNLNARKSAEAEGVEIKIYNVIYDAVNEIRSALEGMLSPLVSEEITSTVEVRDTFKVPKVGTVAGCYVLEGKIHRHNKVRLIRDGIVIFDGELTSLKRFKDDVKEVDAGFECGMGIANYNDIKVGDIIEAYKLIETKKKLD